VIIRLPEQRCLVVDSKVSLTAYEAAVGAESDHARDLAVKTHLQSIRAHMKGLSEKNYQTLHGVSGLDFVLMFIPVEPAFMMAVSHDQELFMDAWQKNVLLVSPSTLLFVVRTVAHLWRQEAQTENAQLIAKQGAELYDKFVGFVKDLESLGERLKQANEDYQDAMGKLSTGKGNLIRRSERLKALGVTPSKALPASLTRRSEPEED
jgi:DNA recombination protein RmuC